MKTSKRSNYTWLLFDVDGTLLDFSGASKQAMWKTFEEFDRECTKELYSVYQKINHQIWSEFEQKLITAEELRYKRFELFFKAIEDQITDPVVFNHQYLENLVVCSEMYEGVIELLTSLKDKYRMSIVTNGLKEVQRRRLDRLGLTSFFESITVSDEIGFAKPSVEYFEYTYASITASPPKSEILVIGDGLQSDILGGKNFEIDTCWIKNGRTNSSNIQPTYEIETVLELNRVLNIK